MSMVGFPHGVVSGSTLRVWIPEPHTGPGDPPRSTTALHLRSHPRASSPRPPGTPLHLRMLRSCPITPAPHIPAALWPERVEEHRYVVREYRRRRSARRRLRWPAPGPGHRGHLAAPSGQGRPLHPGRVRAPGCILHASKPSCHRPDARRTGAHSPATRRTACRATDCACVDRAARAPTNPTSCATTPRMPTRPTTVRPAGRAVSCTRAPTSASSTTSTSGVPRRSGRHVPRRGRRSRPAVHLAASCGPPTGS